ncbi:hypothetical protein [Nocardioides sp. SLBN-35]|uniref:hypothetical protein n=1 Tax=Nocardioides sp. SLBN-35 TaxID=2768445 RepID=UPI001152E01D|nr:hypothetical protein [Nocardioides sp. SLBN-35]TQK72756.1 hypothetical protein FBY23_4573 [Nocardioides sp. SLBN-35]
MTPDADSFRALARSSPWRWRTLLLRARASWLGGEVVAYVDRPGRLVVRDAGGQVHRVQGLPYGSFSLRVGNGPGRPESRRTSLPHEVSPVLRPDGLVAERPLAHFEVDYDDPIWCNYTWVAMLDPVELSHHVRADRVRADVVEGRDVWRADLVPLPGYEPRCGGGCCELLWSEVSWHSDSDGPGTPNWRPVPEGTVFPDLHDVALDLQTGIVLRCLPVGAPDAVWQEMDVLEVDAPAPDWAQVAS